MMKDSQNREKRSWRKLAARHKKMVALSCVLLTVLFNLPILPPSLVASSNGKVLYERFVGNEHCEVDFRHSINKGLIREIFLIDSQQCRITLETGYYQSFGAGMIDTVQDVAALNFRREGDYFRIDFPHSWQNAIPYIGGDIAGHAFFYMGDQVPFGTLWPKQPFTLSVRRGSILKRLTRSL